MKRTKIFIVLGVVLATTLCTIICANATNSNSDTETPMSVQTESFQTQHTPATPINSYVDFTYAAERSVEAVVHVKVKMELKNNYESINPLLEFFFGIPSEPREPQYQEGSGSGVITSTDGYVVTNNHVIDNASTVEVVLNDKRSFEAKVIGTDATTDLALLKIEANNLPTIPFGNSDELKIGEWVLAVGNPLNLTSTVTAGIVSAKARNINISNNEMRIESFIQTDAAVNPGNSGGALVNTKGELVGINTAIASTTGAYTGYSFAIPTSIVNKVVNDLKTYSVVQRAVLGIQVAEITDKLQKEKDLETLQGVYIISINENGAAKDANLKEGDIITSINDIKISSVAQLQEQISKCRPGDYIKVDYIRGRNHNSVNIKLKNSSGNTNIIKLSDNNILGAKFKPVDSKIKNRYNLQYGLQISELESNSILSKEGIKKDFIILKVNGHKIYDERDLTNIINQTINAEDQDRVLFISGINPSGKIYHYAIKLE